MGWLRNGNYVCWTNERQHRFIMGSKGYLAVLLYLLACLIAGMIISVLIVRCVSCQENVGLCSLISLFFPALAGSSLCYLRRMYHLAFSGEPLTQQDASEEEWLRVGTYVYFVTRPLIVSTAVLILLLASVLGISSLLVGLFEMKSQGFVVLSVLAIALGYGGGRSIDDLDNLSNSIGEKLFNRK